MKMLTEGQDKLIEAVKKRPQIYSKYHPQFSDRKVKLALWYEVGRECIPGWDNLTCGQKGEKVCEIQRRWKTLRDGFSRELHLHRQYKMRLKKGEPVKRRRRYGYYSQLKFLLKEKKKIINGGVEDEEDEENNEESSDGDDQDNSYTGNEDSVSQTFKTEPGTSHSQVYVEVQEEQHSDNKGFDTNRSIVDIDGIGEEDEDKLFCLSLVSSFRKMTDKQKYDARIGIMQLMSDIRFKNDTTSSDVLM